MMSSDDDYEETLDPTVVADALHNVAGRAAVEKRERQAQQLVRKSAIIEMLTREPMWSSSQLRIMSAAV